MFSALLDSGGFFRMAYNIAKILVLLDRRVAILLLHLFCMILDNWIRSAPNTTLRFKDFSLLEECQII